MKYEWSIDDALQSETGVVVQKAVPKGTRKYTLKVSDPAHLEGTYTETHTC